MENIQKPEIRSWISEEKVRVADFIQNYDDAEAANATLCIPLRLGENCDTDQPGFTTEEIEQSLLDCDISTLDCDNEQFYLNSSNWQVGHVPESTDLETIKARAIHRERIKHDQTYNVAVQRYGCYKNLEIDHDIERGVIKPEVEEDQETRTVRAGAVKGPQAVLTVQIYRPARAYRNSREAARKAVLNIADQEILVLSSQYLSELKDTLQCVSDIATPGDCSQNPDIVGQVTASDIYKSSCFFINDCFYNDRRNPDNIDYSEEICNWAKNKAQGIGDLHQRSMEQTRFHDLEIRLGHPYLYMHQGDCEHLIVFTELRMYNRITDSPLIAAYPKVRSTSRRIPLRCCLCNLNTAKWLTYDDIRLPEEPFFFCDNCFQTFCYNEQNKPVVNFKAYPYLDKTALL
ncbi:snRNA-activating protein complex subunit 3 [Halotydeus destructor]|nr:snRNA-activating protein complex subunit 3 [Halotydeus destructor]